MHVLPYLDVDGGMEKVLVDGLMHTNRKRVYPMVCCLQEKGGRAPQLEEVGIQVFVEPKRGRRDWAFPLRLAKLLKSRRVDVVHTYSGVYRDGCLAARLARVPVNLHTDQGRFYPADSWKLRLTHRFMTRLRDRVISVSKELKDYLVNEVGLPPEKVTVIYNAVNCNPSHPSGNPDDLQHELGLNDDCPVVGIVGRLVPVKDHGTLLKATARMFAAVPQVRLLVVGEGPLRAELEALARELQIVDRVMFLGHRYDVPNLLPLMDVAVLCSLHEGSSLTLLEAMAAGRAVVATAVGGNPELVLDGVTGLLVPARSPEALADAIVTLLRDPALRASMGQAGKNRVKEHFSIETMVQSYESLYRSLLEQKAS
jgi:sugar transferase (PEP-CTERM/EpsH1 system associated)